MRGNPLKQLLVIFFHLIISDLSHSELRTPFLTKVMYSVNKTNFAQCFTHFVLSLLFIVIVF